MEKNIRIATHLSVLERARVQRNCTVGEKALYFCHEKVALLKEGPHLQLVALQFTSLRRRRMCPHENFDKVEQSQQQAAAIGGSEGYRDHPSKETQATEPGSMGGRVPYTPGRRRRTMEKGATTMRYVIKRQHEFIRRGRRTKFIFRICVKLSGGRGYGE